MPAAFDPHLTGDLRWGRTYRLTVDLALDGLLLGEDGRPPVAYLAQDNSWCAAEDRDWTIGVRRRGHGWELVLGHVESGREAGTVRPRLRPGAYRLLDGSARASQLTRAPWPRRWVLAGERRRIATIQIRRGVPSPREPLNRPDDGRIVAEVTMADRRARVSDPTAQVLLALATIRSRATLPVFSPQ